MFRFFTNVKHKDLDINSNLLKEDNYYEIDNELVEFLDDIHGDSVLNENDKKGLQFEVFLEKLFVISGYEVERTPYRGDGGVDLFIKKDNKCYAIQAKKCKCDVQKLEDVKKMREFAGIVVEEGYQKVFITTNFFTNEAKEQARKSNIELIDKIGLLRLVAQLQPQLMAKGYLKKHMGDLGFCKSCGAPMTVAFGKGQKYAICLNRRVFESEKDRCDSKTYTLKDN